MSKNKKSISFPVDVVISTSGRWDFLKLCLGALKRQTIVPNIIVIDNASDAEERIANQELFEGVKSKRLPNPLGFPSANNNGASMGVAPLILFLNDDCILADPTSIEKMIETMRDETIGILGIKLLFPPDSNSPIRPAGKVQHVGIGLTIKAQVVHPLNAWSSNHPKTNVSRDVFAVTGACLLIRRSLFGKVQGFDTIYGMGTYEDVDLCLKARSLGQRVFVNTSIVGYHYTGATAEKKQTPFPLQMNASIFLSRWQGSPLLVWEDWTYY